MLDDTNNTENCFVRLKHYNTAFTALRGGVALFALDNNLFALCLTVCGAIWCGAIAMCSAGRAHPFKASPIQRMQTNLSSSRDLSPGKPAPF